MVSNLFRLADRPCPLLVFYALFAISKNAELEHIFGLGHELTNSSLKHGRRVFEKRKAEVEGGLHKSSYCI